MSLVAENCNIDMGAGH